MNSSRSIAVRRALLITLALNIAVTLVKLAVGAASGSLSAVADGVQSLLDAASNVLGLLGLWISARPPDHNHPYGHAKYEAVTALGIGSLAFVAAAEIVRNVFGRLSDGGTLPSTTPLAVALMALTFAVNLGVATYEGRLGRRHKSQILVADAAQTRANLFVTVSVVVSLIAGRLGLAWLDSLVAIGVAAVIVKSAFEIVQSTSNVLTDVAAADHAQVERIALSLPSVARVSSIRSRGSAESVYIDLHLQVPRQMDTQQAHSVATEVEHRIAENIPGVVETLVHVEPARSDDYLGAWQELTLSLRRIAEGVGIGLHSVHAHVERTGSYSVECHLEVEAGLTLGQAHTLANQFERQVRSELPQVHSLTTHIEPLPRSLPSEDSLPSEQLDALRQRIQQAADRLAGPGACHDVQLHSVNGHLTATLHIAQPPTQRLTAAHALAQQVEAAVYAQDTGLDRIVVHVEPEDVK